MASPFIGQICMFGFNFAPKNYAFCSGQIMSIAQNTALFSLLGTTYGGNGQTTFALPDLRGRVVVGQGQGPGLANVQLGQVAGEASHTLLTTEIPAHNHPATVLLNASGSPGTSTTPADGFPAASAARENTYAASGGATMNSGAATATVGIAGGSQPHNNMQPYLGINYSICLYGIFPSRN